MAALARVERTDFLSPMCIGEVANVSAEITYTSRHSVEVQVNVMSENILTGGWLLVAAFQNSRNNSVKPRASCGDSILCSVTGSIQQRGDLACLLSWGCREGWCWGGRPSRHPGIYGSIVVKSSKICL